MDAQLFDTAIASRKELTVLSFGAGQESTWILYKLALDPEFRAKYAPGDLVVIGSDTGDEHDETYEHVKFAEEFCLIHGIEFHWVTADQGYHSPAWQSLTGQYSRNNTIGSKAFARTCTSNLKLTPFYRFLAHYISVAYGMPYDPTRLGKTYFPFAAKHGKINVILGFACNEESRAKKTTESLDNEALTSAFRRACTEFSFPLIEMGIDRAATQAQIREMGLPLPPPSNCKRCHFRGEVELVWLHRFQRKAYDEWVVLEQNKIDRFAESTKARNKQNLGYTERSFCPRCSKGRSRNTATGQTNGWKTSAKVTATA